MVPNYVARAGANDYMTIAEAIAAGNGHTVTLLRSTTENVVIPEGKTVTLEIPEGITLSNTLYAKGTVATGDCSTIVNNGTLTITGSGTVLSHCNYDSGVALRNNQGATATLRGCTFINDNQSSAISARSYYVIQNFGTMDIYAPTEARIERGSPSVLVNGWHNGSDNTTREPAIMNIYGGNFSGGWIVVKNDDCGVMTISGGEFKPTTTDTNKPRAVMTTHKLTITGGNFTSAHAQYATIEILQQEANSDYGAGEMTISGNPVFTNTLGGGNIDIRQGGGGNGTAVIAISSGKFSTQVEREWCATGLRPTTTADADGYYTVERIPTTPPTPSTPDEPDEPIVDIEDDPTALGDRPFIFEDVHENDWFYNEVKNIFEHGLINGMTTTTYEPQTELTRGMIVTILWRIAGEPTVETTSTFTDVPENAYYFDAINWGAANNIARGYDEKTFAPDRLVSREELAALIYRYAELIELDLTGIDDEAFAEFDDAETVLPWFVENMKWAINAGIVKGDNGSLLPQDRATRAEAAAMVNRFIQMPEVAAIMQANAEAEAETSTDAE